MNKFISANNCYQIFQPLNSENKMVFTGKFL